jgi:hypothetical protein
MALDRVIMGLPELLFWFMCLWNGTVFGIMYLGIVLCVCIVIYVCVRSKIKFGLCGCLLYSEWRCCA